MFLSLPKNDSERNQERRKSDTERYISPRVASRASEDVKSKQHHDRAYLQSALSV